MRTLGFQLTYQGLRHALVDPASERPTSVNTSPRTPAMGIRCRSIRYAKAAAVAVFGWAGPGWRSATPNSISATPSKATSTGRGMFSEFFLQRRVAMKLRNLVLLVAVPVVVSLAGEVMAQGAGGGSGSGAGTAAGAGREAQMDRDRDQDRDRAQDRDMDRDRQHDEDQLKSGTGAATGGAAAAGAQTQTRTEAQTQTRAGAAQEPVYGAKPDDRARAGELSQATGQRQNRRRP